MILSSLLERHHQQRLTLAVSFFQHHLLRVLLVSGASAFQVVALALLGFLTTRFLSIEDFGTTRTVTAYVVFFSIFGHLCLHDGIASYVAGSSSLQERKRYLANGGYLVFLASLILVLVLESVAISGVLWAGNLRKAMMIVCAFLPALAFGTVYMNLCSALGAHRALGIQYFLWGLIPLVIISFGSFYWELNGWILTRCASYALLLLIALYFIREYLELCRPDRRSIRELLSFSRVHMFGGILSMWFINSDIIVMERLSINMKDIANYGLASMFAKSILVIPSTIGRVYFLDISKAMTDRRKFHQLTRNLILTTTAVCLLIAIVVWVGAPYVILTFFGTSFTDSIELMRILCVGILFKGLWSILTPIMVAMKEPRGLLWINIVATCVSMPLFFLLIPRYGTTGAAWAMNLGYCSGAALGVLAMYFLGQKIRDQGK